MLDTIAKREYFFSLLVPCLLHMMMLRQCRGSKEGGIAPVLFAAVRLRACITPVDILLRQILNIVPFKEIHESVP